MQTDEIRVKVSCLALCIALAKIARVIWPIGS
jgi:hypothetical protein